MNQREIGNLFYKGNSVSHWKAKADANGRRLLEAWEALKEHGIYPGNDMSISDGIRELVRRESE